ncbi:MAG: site-specific DNA-methyltransferase [Acidimicrobiales bacterium]|nr:site-specific DNA-methyltransferase [Acidimicrobiales bacterium]
MPPETVAGGGVDLSALEGLSHDELISLVEQAIGGGITITFAGKANATRIARKVRPRVIRRSKPLSAGSAEAQAANLLIEGDNLQAMATLFRERGQVDLILTDPPYNTGNDFRYNDKWEEDPNDTGMGELVSSEDGARHTKWMRFMWPRLQMMRSMLKPGGVLAICIDHRELFHMGQMLDELFLERNRLAIINWQKSYAPRNDNKHISTATEYVLVYARDTDKAKTGLTERSEQAQSAYRNPDNDPKGVWSPADSTAPSGPTHQGMLYGIQNPYTGQLVYPPNGRCWVRERAKMKSGLQGWGLRYEDRDIGDTTGPALLIKGAKNPKELDNPLSDPKVKAARTKALARWEQGDWPELYFRQGGKGGREIGLGQLRFKNYLEEVRKGVVATTYWADEDIDPIELGSTSWEHEQSGHSQSGQTELSAVVGRGHGFDTVKPLKLFEKIIQLWCPPDGLVMDPFAGSGTTGHAAMSLNEKSGSARRFILVEQGRPEKGDPYASSLTANRLKRVVSGDWATGKHEPLAGGFSFLRLDKRVDAQALLQMERDEMVDTVIASHFDANRKRGSNLIRVNGRDWKHLVAKNSDNEGFFLIWGGPDKNTDFDSAVYEECATEAEAAGLKPNYHVYARLYLYQTENVRFYQIPDRILADFGLDMASEPFAEPT